MGKRKKPREETVDEDLQESLDELSRLSDELIESLEGAQDASQAAVSLVKPNGESASMLETLEELERIGEPETTLERPFASELHGDKARDIDAQLESVLGFETREATPSVPASDTSVDLDIDLPDMEVVGEQAFEDACVRADPVESEESESPPPEELVELDVPPVAAEISTLRARAEVADAAVDTVALDENEATTAASDAVDAMAVTAVAPRETVIARPAAANFDVSMFNPDAIAAPKSRRWMWLGLTVIVISAVLAWWFLRGTPEAPGEPAQSLSRVPAASPSEPSAHAVPTAEPAATPAVNSKPLQAPPPTGPTSSAPLGKPPALPGKSPASKQVPPTPAASKAPTAAPGKQSVADEDEPSSTRPLDPPAAAAHEIPPPPVESAAALAPVLALDVEATEAIDAAPVPQAPTTERIEEPAAPPVQRVAPRAIEPTQPIYPARAREQGQQGTVVLNVLVNERGQVLRVVVEQGIPGSDLEAAAIDAVLRRQYEPATEDGRPVRGWVRETFDFEP